MKILEAISFGAIALSLHITVVSFFFPEILGSNQKEDESERETIISVSYTHLTLPTTPYV